MSSPFSPFPSTVPVVGQPFEVYQGVVSVIIACKCQATNKPFLLHGHDQVVVCVECGNAYTIVSVQYLRDAKTPPKIQVALIGNKKADIDRLRAAHRPQGIGS